MTRYVPTAVPGCAALIAGTFFGLEASWCPPGYAAVLAALGLALRGETGRTLTFLAVGLMIGSLQDEQGLQPAADRPVVMRVEITGVWRADEDGIRVTARGLWIRQGLEVAGWNQDLRLV